MIGIDVTPLLLERRRGVARALASLLEGLARIERSEPVVLLAPREPTLEDGLPELDGVRIVPAPTARRFRRSARRTAGELDAFVSPWLASVRTDPKTVVLVHELPFVRLGPVEGRLRAFRQRVWLKRHLRSGAQLVTPSEATRADLLRLHPEAAERTTVIPHGFDPEPWASGVREPVARPYAVIVGTGVGAAGVRKKGIDRVPAIRQALEGRLGLLVVGDTHVPDDDLVALVASAHVLICPSRSEGFGFPPLEAMAAGVPVVATDGGALPEVVGDAGLVVDGAPAVIAEAALRAAFDEPTRAALIAKGRRRARTFSLEAAAEAWLHALSRTGARS